MLCGGAGTRFWPASRRALPKAFLPLLEQETLLETTLARSRLLAPAERCWVVSARSLSRVTRSALRSQRGVHLLLEPVARNTAAAVAWAAARIAREASAGVMVVLPADHHIPRPAGFVRTIRAAARAAADGEHLVLVGIEPTRPDTAYGYFRIGPSGPDGVASVRRFVEKPDPARARRYLRSGQYLWNAGMIVSTPQRILAETRAHAPEVWKTLGGVLEAIAGGRRVPHARLESAYRRVRGISFDHAVLERTRRVRALRGRFPWSDLGSWDALAEHLPLVGGNRVRGPQPAAVLDASDNVVWNTSGRALVLLGVHGLVVIETPDAVLVCAKDRVQDIRRIVDQLTKHGRKDLV
ncbi:MAG: sugar phosphate nucleotidyltransferase [Deltaproteobacteria bacterium]|nr:sugar phosphate nucleotidyltransferase [Deltaproteobacteria bacterium]